MTAPTVDELIHLIADMVPVINTGIHINEVRGTSSLARTPLHMAQQAIRRNLEDDGVTAGIDFMLAADITNNIRIRHAIERQEREDRYR